MCGRFVSSSPPDELARYFSAAPTDVVLDASWNVAPTDDVWGVVETTGAPRRLDAFHWGLVPTWAPSVATGTKMINARAETIGTRNAYKHAFRKRRCLVPMDGFYEWQAPEGRPAKAKARKQPVYVHRPDGEPLAVAGLWEVWRDRDAGPDAPWLRSLTVITTLANETMRPVHDRMPVILPPSVWAQWLDPANHDLDALSSLLVPAPDDLLVLHPVSLEVNDVRHQGPQLIDVVDPAALASAAAAAAEQASSASDLPRLF